MVLTKKYIIGTHVMFYELEMVEELFQSIANATMQVDNPENITVDILFNFCEYFGQIDTTQISKEQLKKLSKKVIKCFDETGVNLQIKYYDKVEPFTMIDYRRDLNHFGSQVNDLVIWGESDCLVPEQMFTTLDTLSNYAFENNIHRYVATFAIRKMWDKSWEPLEHVEFTDKVYYEKDNELCWTSPHSIRYTMSINEMNNINSKYNDLDLRLTTTPQFDGAILILSADLIKSGVNIPPGMWGIAAEDTAMMFSCRKNLGSNYRQFIIKNILKVHNREHPKKRLYIKDFNSNNISTQQNKGKWNNVMRDMNKKNLDIIFNRLDQRILTYDDFEKEMK